MKNKHRIKQGLSLLLAGGIALTNLGAVMPAFAEDAPATPETAETATPESAVSAEQPAVLDNGLSVEEIQSRMYPSLPQTATGYYLDSNGLPVLTGETKISIEGWGDEDYRDYDADSTIQVALDEGLLNTDSATASFPRMDGEDYAIVPISIASTRTKSSWKRWRRWTVQASTLPRFWMAFPPTSTVAVGRLPRQVSSR